MAVAEAKVHGKTVDEVHFHEVGAVDSIIDVVGAAICIDALGVDKIMSSSVQLGGGFVMCDHGKFQCQHPRLRKFLKMFQLEWAWYRLRRQHQQVQLS